MTQESGEIRPNESDVAHIAANLKGWGLMEPQEKGSGRWVLDRKTTDGKHLVLGIDTTTGEVDLKEWGEGGATFSIMCRKIKSVDTSYGNITLSGDVEYRISSEGVGHQVFLPNANPYDWIVSKSYMFD